MGKPSPAAFESVSVARLTINLPNELATIRGPTNSARSRADSFAGYRDALTIAASRGWRTTSLKSVQRLFVGG